MKEKACPGRLVVLVTVLMLTSLVLCSPTLAGKDAQPPTLAEIEQQLDAYAPDPIYPDDPFAIVALREALAAAKAGNYGIGACLIREPGGQIVQKGQNRLFHPYFRSDLHAEMDTLTRFEERMNSPKSNVEGLVLFTSVEPCPMCTARIITSGIKNVRYLAPDDQGGMMHMMGNLPPVWQKIAKGRKYTTANCSPRLKEMAQQIFMSSARSLDKALEKR